MPSLTICNQTIPVDSNNRINLNALHRASGTQDNKRPSKWLSNQSTKELINELESSPNLGSGVITKAQRGKNQGTFAHELLAISYAGWISPKFQLQVNQAFLNYKRPIPKIIANPVITKPAPHQILIDKDKYIELLETTLKAIQQQQPRQNKAPIPLSHEEKQAIVRLKQQGLGYGQIAHQVGRSRSAVRNVVIEFLGS